jgi:hypothetical protein
VGLALPRPAVAIPVFARIYDKPCGTCHTVFPQLNPAGESFRMHGMHGLDPAIAPIKIGNGFEVPGTLPLALYVAGGENVSVVDVPGQRDPIESHFNLDFLRVLGGGELGRHLAFLFDHEMLEMEAESGEVVVNTLPYQAYLTAHLARFGWLGNLKGGWYELPLGVSQQIHRLSVRPYLTYGLVGCALLGVDPPGGRCDDAPTLGETQLGAELAAHHEASGFGWVAGFTNGSNNLVDGTASKDLYVRASQTFGASRLGIYAAYNPDLVGHGVDDRGVRFGPDLDVYSRRFRLLGQFLAGHESNPTGRDRGLWYYGSFLEGQYRLTKDLLALLRVEYAWTQAFDDTDQGGVSRVRKRIWEATAGWQWLLVENVRVIAEVTYGEDADTVSDQTASSWTGTLRLATAFWPLTPPFLSHSPSGARP